jgi:radical SAM superfamily enzyme YgiQ (UPF0313 family)
MNKDKNIVILFYPISETGDPYTNIPWALLRLERVVRDLNVSVIFIDERVESNYEGTIINHKDNILFAGVSSMIGAQMIGGIKFCQTFRTISSMPIIWGGWFPTIYPEIILAETYADAICVGQGEVPFRAFTERVLAGISFKDIPGIGYSENGRFIINQNHKFVNPDLFPPINLDLIDINKLIDLNGEVPLGKRHVDYLATTGCTNNCAFCSAAKVFGRKWYTRSITEIINDIKYLVDKANVSHIESWDENIFANKKFIFDFCNELNKSKIPVTWSGYAHIGYFIRHFSDSDIKFLHKSGCREIRLGGESGDQDVLDLVNKNIKTTETIKVVKLLKRNNMPTRLCFITCFPMNPDKDFWETMCFMGKLKLIYPQIELKIRFFVPIAQTELYNLSIERGFCPPLNMNELIKYFSKDFMFHYVAPWVEKDYSNILNNFANFYYLFTDPFYYKKFKSNKRVQMFIINMVMYPIVYIRFHLKIFRFPIEIKLFKRIVEKCYPFLKG